MLGFQHVGVCHVCMGTNGVVQNGAHNVIGCTASELRFDCDVVGPTGTALAFAPPLNEPIPIRAASPSGTPTNIPGPTARSIANTKTLGFGFGHENRTTTWGSASDGSPVDLDHILCTWGNAETYMTQFVPSITMNDATHYIADEPLEHYTNIPTAFRGH